MADAGNEKNKCCHMKEMKKIDARCMRKKTLMADGWKQNLMPGGGNKKNLMPYGENKEIWCKMEDMRKKNWCKMVEMK